MVFQQQIKNIYDDVYRWLIFAETKHVALVTFHLAVITILNNQDGAISLSNVGFLYAVISGFYISMLLSLISFFPQLNKFELLLRLCHRKRKIDMNNPFFYETISVLSLNTSEIGFRDGYYDLLYKKFCDKNRELLSANEGMINQIIDISKVTTIKYYLFELSIKVTLFSLCIMILLIIIA